MKIFLRAVAYQHYIFHYLMKYLEIKLNQMKFLTSPSKNYTISQSNYNTISILAFGFNSQPTRKNQSGYLKKQNPMPKAKSNL